LAQLLQPYPLRKTTAIFDSYKFMYSPDKYILTVGLTERCNSLKNLPVRLCSVNTGFEALKQLRLEVPSVLIGLWDLPDMPDGELFRRVLAGAASVATVTLIEFGNTSAEVAARRLGVTVVLDEGVDKQILSELLSQLSGTIAATGT
jgi:DNA-binding NarL/FixJ family response regulator